MHEVIADLALTVVRIFVDDGEQVQSDRLILLGECMKAEIPVYAGVAGIVQIKVSVGDYIQDGDVLATVEAP